MAQKLKFGNGTWATKEGSTLAYNDENNNYKPLPFTTTRNSIGTRVNKEGLIEVVGNDIPRIDYTDSSDGVLLLENSSTNLITYSEDFTQWETLTDGTGVTPVITTNNSISPDGTQNADKIVFSRTSAGSSDYTLIKKDYGGSDINGIASIYLKSDANVNIEITSDDINYKTITVTTDWKRFEVSDSTSDRLTFGLRGSEPSTLDATIYAWGAQLESGNLSSYIPTSGSSVTRQAETASGSGNSEVFNDSEGVLYFEASALADDNIDKRLTLSDGTMNNYVSIGYSRFTGNIIAEMISGGVLQTIDWGATGVTQTNNHKFVMSWGSGTMKFYISGFQRQTASVNSPTGMDNIRFANAVGNLKMYAKTKELGYYDEILTDLELETLTSYRSLNELVTELNLNTL